MYICTCTCIIKSKTILKDKNKTIPVTSYATITLDYEELATPCLTIERRHTWGPTLRAVSDSSSELPSSRPWAWAMRAPCTMFPTWTAEGVTSKTTDTGAWIFLLLKRSVNKRQINYTICVVQITCY